MDGAGLFEQDPNVGRVAEPDGSFGAAGQSVADPAGGQQSVDGRSAVAAAEECGDFAGGEPVSGVESTFDVGRVHAGIVPSVPTVHDRHGGPSVRANARQCSKCSNCAILDGMTEQPNTDRANGREPWKMAAASWAVLFASFGLSASTWVALAELSGFRGTAVVFGCLLRLAWLMPVAVDGYVVVALVLWMAPVPEDLAAFARKNTYAAAGAGVVAQAAYHGLLVGGGSAARWWHGPLAAVVGAMPPALAAAAVHMRSLRGRAARTVFPAEQVAPVAVPDVRSRVVTFLPVVPTGGANTVPAELAEQGEANAPEVPVDEVEVPDEPIAAPFAPARTPSAPEANTARTSGGVPANMAAIKREFKDWKTTIPSVRKIADLLGVSVSTGAAYRQRLIEDRTDPPARDPEPADTDPHRELTGART